MAKKTEYELLISIGAQVNKSVEASLGNVTGLLKKAFGAKIIWDGVTALGSKVVEIGAESVQMYSELETAAVNAANVFGGTREEVDAIEESIKNLAVETSKEIPYTAKEIADSVYYLGQVGLGFEEATAVMDDMLKLAYADGQDVATVVDMITDSMSGLQMEITPENVNSYMNQIAEIMATTNTSAMGALETIMGFGGTSGMLGENIQEVSTALGILANSGIKGSEAGTALNSIMTRMISNTAPVRKAYKDLGVSLYDETGDFRGFGEVLEDVNEALKTMSDEQKNPLLKNMFGTHYMNAANILLTAVDAGEDGVSVYDELLEKQYSVGNRLEQMYQNAIDTTEAQGKLAQNNLAANEITLGESVAGAYKEVLAWANANFFPDLEEKTDALAIYIRDNVTPNIQSGLDSLKNGFDDFISEEKVVGIRDNLTEAGDNMSKALQDVDWNQMKEVGTSIKDAGVALLDGATQALAWLTEYGASPALELASNVLGLGADGLDALSGNYSGESHSPWAKSAKERIEQWQDDTSSFWGNVWGGAVDIWKNVLGIPTNEAEDKLKELREDASGSLDLINLMKDQMNSTNDPTQISIYKQAINDWQTELDRTLAQIRQIESAMGGTASSGKYNSNPKNKGEAKMLPFADGGIVTRPTIGLIGETGEKEAVIPLSKLGSVVGQLTGGGNITYTQVVHINGNANPDEVKQAMSQSYAEFKANWQRLQKEQRRAAF